ncbi:MAG: nucleotidyltransferase domain-containing protein [Candidatus Omnitrophica bacterium]|nr:nucleotidyltransferase domain-containing protein [Candidatus Omnitrophota bacterium]
MAKLFFKNKLQQEILAYTFTHEKKSFYVRELAGLINEDAGNLSREMRKLEEEGLFLSSVKGRERFYCLNKAYPVFKELRDIVFKTVGIEGSLKRAFSRIDNIDFSCLYGSYAQSKAKLASDVDIIVVGDFSQKKFLSAIRKLEQNFGREINYTSYTPKEFEQERKKIGSFLNLVLQKGFIPLKGKLKNNA